MGNMILARKWGVKFAVRHPNHFQENQLTRLVSSNTNSGCLKSKQIEIIWREDLNQFWKQQLMELNVPLPTSKTKQFTAC